MHEKPFPSTNCFITIVCYQENNKWPLGPCWIFLQLWHRNGTEYKYMFNLFMPLVRIKEIMGTKSSYENCFSLRSDFPRQCSPPDVGDNLDSCLSWSELKSKVWLSSLWFPSSIPSTILLRKIGIMEQFHKHHIHNYAVKITPKRHIFKQW